MMLKWLQIKIIVKFILKKSIALHGGFINCFRTGYKRGNKNDFNSLICINWQ